MHRRVTTGAPAVTTAQKFGVRRFANEDLAANGMDLRVTFQAEIIVALDEHLRID